MWWFHFWHLAERSWAQVLAWRGTTTLSILIETIVPVTLLVFSARFTTGHWPHNVAVFRNQARDLFKATVITVGALLLIVFLAAVPVTVLRDHNDLVAANARLISETRKLRAAKEPAPQQSVNPDESNRARALRDRHFELLRPILRSESSHLKGIAEQIRTQGHFAPMREGEDKNTPSTECGRRRA